MAILNLQLKYSFFSSSSYSLPSPYTPQNQTPQLFIILKPPKTPTKTSNISISLLNPKISAQNNRKILTRSSSTPIEEQEEGENRREEAIEAVKEYLTEAGASTENAVNISVSCPNYLNSLIDAVNDLDDWNSWNATEEDITANSMEFKKKVYQMAGKKGDKGTLPFLESLGLSLSSANRLARYVSSSHTLPILIHKVKYLKEILFSGSDDNGLIGKNAQRMMALFLQKNG